MDDLELPASTKPTPQPWMLSFADLVSLLLCFFVLMFSMKAVDHTKWIKMSGSLRGVFAEKQGITWTEPDGFNNADKVTNTSSDGLKYLNALLHRRMEADPVWGKVNGVVVADRNRLRYPLPEAFWKTPGTADTAVISRLAAILRNFKNRLVVEVSTQGPASKENYQKALAAAAALQSQGVKVLYVEDAPEAASKPQIQPEQTGASQTPSAETPKKPATLWLSILGKDAS